ncbi:MAG: GNAT family N-acetyltransferase [Candidatus Nanoarchaeia archaeon]
MEIKKAKKRDARKISILRRNTLRKINNNDYSKVFIDSLIKNNSYKGTIDKLKKRETFCAWNKNILLGTVDLEGDKIGGLYIKSSKIGKGLGTLLMNFIENYAISKGIKKVRLYSTKFAFNFYKKRGYKLTKSGYWIIGKSKHKDRLMEKILK